MDNNPRILEVGVEKITVKTNKEWNGKKKEWVLTKKDGSIREFPNVSFLVKKRKIDSGRGIWYQCPFIECQKWINGSTVLKDTHLQRYHGLMKPRRHGGGSLQKNPGKEENIK